MSQFVDSDLHQASDTTRQVTLLQIHWQQV